MREVQPPVVVADVTRRFGDLVAASGVSLEVGAGTILGLIGPSGSGKTTMIRMLTGTLAPSSGDIAVLGERPWHFRRQTRERIGYMPQQFHLYPHLTCRENVSFCATLFGLFWWERRRRVREVLEICELWTARDRLAKDLSGGMQRRLSLACALVHDPEVLFIDEPTAGLDPLLRQRIWEEFRRLRDDGHTLFVTTQSVTDAEYCDYVAMLVRGQLVAVGRPEELRRQVFGGEVVDVRTRGVAHPRVLTSLPGVREVRQRGPDHVIVVADEAASAVPRIVDAMQAAGDRVLSAQQYEPSFDDVFVALVEQSGIEEPQELAS